MSDTVLRRDGVRVAGVGIGAGAAISIWNLIGMYTAVPIAIWDVGRQILFIATLVCIAALAVRAARTGRSWGVTGAWTTLAAMLCAATVLGSYAVSTAFGTGSIRQVPEFIRDYTNNGYSSPAIYFADRYWGLLKLQVFTWAIGVAGLVAVGTILGRVAARIWPQRAP